jgi:hypothetical protein
MTKYSFPFVRHYNRRLQDRARSKELLRKQQKLHIKVRPENKLIRLRMLNYSVSSCSEDFGVYVGLCVVN